MEKQPPKGEDFPGSALNMFEEIWGGSRDEASGDDGKGEEKAPED